MAVKPKSWGYVYIVQSFERFKIGYSGDIPKLRNRLSRLHMMNAYGIEPVIIIRHRRAHTIEVQLQNRFDDKHTHGEWYILSPQDILVIRKDYHRHIYGAGELGVW